MRSGMMPRQALLLATMLLPGALLGAETVVKEALRSEDAGENLLSAAAWRSLSGQEAGAGQLCCDNGADGAVQRGWTQTVVLRQRQAAPIMASVWSRAEEVGGLSDSDYALYLDLHYMDGEPLWGQVAPCRCGTHDWQRVEVKVLPAKPVKEVSVYLLLRRHTGTAWFRDARCIQADPAMESFDGVAVRQRLPPARGFLVRDVAARSGFVAIADGGQALGLALRVRSRSERGAELFSCELTDLTGGDRAVTLAYTSPLEGGVWSWLDGADGATPVQARREYRQTFASQAGSGSGISPWPLAAVASGASGRAVALDLGAPAVFRVGVGGEQELYISFDVGLAKERPCARVGLATFPFTAVPGTGLRPALAMHARVFPDEYRLRTPRQGLWMPFHAISTVPAWEDFGFAFKEGDEEKAWDAAHGILTFRYTEPMTWWMPLPKDAPRTLDGAQAQARRLAAQGDAQAQALFASGFHDDDGRLVAQLRREPWCDGAVWSINSAPGMGGAVTDFGNKWNPALCERLHGPGARPALAGEYIDSVEGWVTRELDFRREHFPGMGTPLTFAGATCRPAIFRGLIVFEYVRAIARDVRERNHLMMGNGIPNRYCWMAPLLDVMGTETDWHPAGVWRPMTREELFLRRALCGPKPYCLLMNTDFAAFPRPLVERYMKRALAYGMFPGFFSHNASEGQYFSRPDLYERDRELFRTYVPLCRLLAQAGWRALPGAACATPGVWVEGFGDRYLTVFNANPAPATAEVRLAAPGREGRRCRELLGGGTLEVRGGAVTLALGSEEVAVLEVPAE